MLPVGCGAETTEAGMLEEGGGIDTLDGAIDGALRDATGTEAEGAPETGGPPGPPEAGGETETGGTPEAGGETEAGGATETGALAETGTELERPWGGPGGLLEPEGMTKENEGLETPELTGANDTTDSGIELAGGPMDMPGGIPDGGDPPELPGGGIDMPGGIPDGGAPPELAGGGMDIPGGMPPFEAGIVETIGEPGETDTGGSTETPDNGIDITLPALDGGPALVTGGGTAVFAGGGPTAIH